MKVKELHLVAFYVKKPRNPRMTHIKGYMSDPANFQYDENIAFTRGLSTKDRSLGGVVLNLNTKTVVKNTYDSEQKNFDQLFKYFLEGYPQYVAKAMADLDLEYLKQFLPADETVEVAPETTEQ